MNAIEDAPRYRVLGAVKPNDIGKVGRLINLDGDGCPVAFHVQPDDGTKYSICAHSVEPVITVGETYRATVLVQVTEIRPDGEVRGVAAGLPFFTTSPGDWTWERVAPEDVPLAEWERELYLAARPTTLAGGEPVIYHDRLLDPLPDRFKYAFDPEWPVTDHAERDVCLAAIWKMYAALGFDTDGDPTPAAMVAGMGLDGFLAAMVSAAEQAARDYADALEEIPS